MSMPAGSAADLESPWNTSQSVENIAYGVAGSVGGNLQGLHAFNYFTQIEAQLETRPASISAYLCIKY
jgi:hypothetical protein